MSNIAGQIREAIAGEVNSALAEECDNMPELLQGMAENELNVLCSEIGRDVIREYIRDWITVSVSYTRPTMDSPGSLSLDCNFDPGNMGRLAPLEHRYEEQFQRILPLLETNLNNTAGYILA